VTSPTKGCGKTTILRLLDKLARRPKRAGSISPPALFRVVEMFQPTLLLDENEKYLEHGGDLHALINEGHCKGATVMRVLGDKLELREFSIFGALAFARNGKVPDDLEQRSIVIVMQRRKSTEALQELRDDRCEPLTLLARKCARWSEDNVGALIGADPDMGGLINRNADNWRPLFAIADAIGGDWPENIRKAAAALVQLEADSMATQLLADIRMVFDTQNGEWADRIFSETLAGALADIEGSRWAEYGTAKKPITKNELARLVKGFKIVPDTVRIGSKTLKGYHRHQFEDVWSRYLGQGVGETSQRNNPTAASTSGPFPNVTEKTVVTDEKCEKSLRPNDCDVVTFQNPKNDPTHAYDLDIPEFLRRDAPAPIEQHTCEQRRSEPDGTERLIGAAWLHTECVRFWKLSPPG
jgi:putative DNA primase/helicase